MRSLLPLQLAVALALCAWLWIKTTAVDALPDWHQGELVVIVPPAEMETENAFETELAGLFAQQLQVKVKLVPLPIRSGIACADGSQGASGNRRTQYERLRGALYQGIPVSG